MKNTLLVSTFSLFSSFIFAQGQGPGNSSIHVSGKCLSGVHVVTTSDIKNTRAEVTSFVEKSGFRLNEAADCRVYLNAYKTKKGLVVKSALYNLKSDEVYLLSINEYRGSNDIDIKRITDTSLRKLKGNLPFVQLASGSYDSRVLEDMPETLNAVRVTDHLELEEIRSEKEAMRVTDTGFGKMFHRPTVKGPVHEKVISNSSGTVYDFYRVNITDEYKVGAPLHTAFLAYGPNLSSKKTEKKLKNSALGFCKLQGFQEVVGVNTRDGENNNDVVDGAINGSSTENFAILDPKTSAITGVLSDGMFSILSNVTCK